MATSGIRFLGLDVPAYVRCHARHARPRLPCRGSLGPHFPAPAAPRRGHRYYARLRLPYALRVILCLSLVTPFPCLPPVCSLSAGAGRWPHRRCRDSSFCGASLLAPRLRGRPMALPGSRLSPVAACRVLRPRRCLVPWPSSGPPCCLLPDRGDRRSPRLPVAAPATIQISGLDSTTHRLAPRGYDHGRLPSRKRASLSPRPARPLGAQDLPSSGSPAGTD